MLSALGPTGLNQILKEVKEAEEENVLNRRQEAQLHFNARMAHLKAQVDTLKKQASEIGRMGFFNLAMGLAHMAMNVAAQFMPGLTAAASKGVQAFLQTLVQGLQKGIDLLQGFENQRSQKTLKNLDAASLAEGMRAEVEGKRHADAKEEEAQAKQRAQRSLEVLKEVQKEAVAAQESMVRLA